MAYISLTQRVKELETQIRTIMAGQDVDSLTQIERMLVPALKNQATDARLEVRDYEYADTRESQLKHAQVARKYLQTLLQSVVKASEYGLFGAVDVAHITSQIESVADALE